MTNYRAVPYHQIPDSYAAQTLARAEEVYGRPEVDEEAVAYWAEQEEIAVRDEWQNERAEQEDRYVDESDVDRPDTMLVTATNGHVWHVSPARNPYTI